VKKGMRLADSQTDAEGEFIKNAVLYILPFIHCLQFK